METTEERADFNVGLHNLCLARVHLATLEALASQLDSAQATDAYANADPAPKPDSPR